MAAIYSNVGELWMIVGNMGAELGIRREHV